MSASDGELRVLHVDDSPEFAEGTARVLNLEADDITVEPATSVSEALDLLADREFDCIVSDYDMPGMDGLAFLDHVREAEPDLPFILFTGKGSEEVASEAIHRGVTDYIQKDASADQYTVLANRIRNAVSNYRARRDAADTRSRFETLLDRYRFETLTTHNFEVHFILDRAGRCTYASHSIEPLLGYTPEEMIGEDLFDYVHPADRESAREEFAEVLDDEGYAGATEFRMAHDDGSWVALEVRGRNRLDDPGIGGVVVVGRDVTERRRHEHAAQRLETRLEEIAQLVDEQLEPAADAAAEELAAARADRDDDLAAVARAHDRLDDGLADLRSLTEFPD